jgi:hypothetical protein
MYHIIYLKVLPHKPMNNYSNFSIVVVLMLILLVILSINAFSQNAYLVNMASNIFNNKTSMLPNTVTIKNFYFDS